MKIPKKYSGFVLGGIVSTFMSVFMSLFVTFINLGYSADFWNSWGQAFIRSWPLAFLLAIIITPQAKKFVERHTVR